MMGESIDDQLFQRVNTTAQNTLTEYQADILGAIFSFRVCVVSGVCIFVWLVVYVYFYARVCVYHYAACVCIARCNSMVAWAAQLNNDKAV